MIVDVHTHVMWYPDHIAREYAEEALAAKLVKLRNSGGEAYSARLDLHSYDARPAEHWEASSTADRVIVFGIQARASGLWVPNDVVADYVATHPEKLVGWASVDPATEGHLDELVRCVDDLGLVGLKLGPPYQHFDPSDRANWPLYEFCQARDLPIMWHQGTTFPTRARLRVASPLLLEDVAMAFPDLRMIVAHLGHPWEEDVVALIRKCPNVYADVSALHYRPWRFWQALVTAYEYGVDHKLLLGSDFPSATLDNVISGLRRVNEIVEGTKLPHVPLEALERIVHENWRAFFPEWA